MSTGGVAGIIQCMYGTVCLRKLSEKEERERQGVERGKLLAGSILPYLAPKLESEVH